MIYCLSIYLKDSNKSIDFDFKDLDEATQFAVNFSKHTRNFDFYEINKLDVDCEMHWWY